MVKEEILEGIRQSVAKGESLQNAMQTFYNSGYEKKDIMEAARAFQLEEFQKKTQPDYNPKTSQNPQHQNQKPIQKPVIPGKPAQTFQAIKQQPSATKIQEIKTAIRNKVPQSLKVNLNSNNTPSSSQKTMKTYVPSSIIPRKLFNPSSSKKVSDYSYPSQTTTKSKSHVLIIALVVILLFLIGALIGVFFFKEKILGLFGI